MDCDHGSFRAFQNSRDESKNLKLLPYLKFAGDYHFDIDLQVGIQPKDSEEKVVTKFQFQIYVLECGAAISSSHSQRAVTSILEMFMPLVQSAEMTLLLMAQCWN